MARRGGNVRVRFTSDTSDLERGSRSAERDLSRLSDRGSRSLGTLKTAATVAGAALTGAVVLGAKEAADAAIESEKANARLQAQLVALGIRYSQHEGQIQRVIDKHSQLSGFDDEDLGDSFTNIVRVVGDVNKALDLNVIAMDFARAKNMDVAKAGELVGKVAGGNTGILSRYGIQIEKGATATEALGVLQEKFAGQAKEYGETTGGSADRAQVAFENLGETLGSKVTPLIADAATGFSELIRQYTLGEGPGGRIRDVVEGVGDAAEGTVGTVRDLVNGFRDGEPPARLLAGAVSGLATAFIAFKVGGVVAAGLEATRKGLERVKDVDLATTRGLLGFIGIAASGLATAFAILSVKTRDNEVSARAFNDALRAQREAMREIADIELDEAQRKANLRSATIAVERAENTLKETRKEHGRNSLEAKQAEADLRQARISQRRASVDLARVEEDANEKRRKGKETTRELSKEERKLNGDINDQISDREKEIRGIDESIEAVKRQGGNYDVMRGTVKKLRDRQRELRDEINSLKSKKVDVEVKFKLSPAPGSSFGTFGDGVGRAVRSSVSKVAQSAIGLGAFTAGMGGLDGADMDLAPIAAIAAGLGGYVSSGLRPGAVTSSGNPSYHATGDAVDIGGSIGVLRRVAVTLHRIFGPRLRELISPWPDLGIKDGRPFRYSAQIQREHGDHVHAAFTGPFGDGDGRQGDGLGRFASTAYGPPWGGIQGTGVTATGVDLRPARKIFGIAVDPRRLKLGAKYFVWPNPFGHRGPFRAFDTGGAIKGNRIDFYDWRGRRSQNTWGRRDVTVSTTAPRDDSGGGNTVLGPGGTGRNVSPNMSAGVGSTTGGRGGGLGFEGKLARNDVAQARAERDDNLPALLTALRGERRIMRRRLKRVNKLLSNPRLKKAARTALLQEKAQLIRDIGDLNDTIAEYKADQAGGATTISRADELDAGIDPNADTGDPGGGDPGGTVTTTEADPNVARLADLMEESNQIERRKVALMEAQGPQMLGALAAYFSGSIGQTIGLGGFQAVGIPGQLART